MGKSLWNKSGVATAELIFLALDQTVGIALDDGDRFVEVMRMAWQGGAWKKSPIAAANTYGAESMRKKIAEERILGKLIDGIILTSDDGLGIFFQRVARPAIVDGKKTICQLTNRVCGGEGPMGDQLSRRIFVLDLVSDARGNMHAISRTQLIGPALDEHASRALDYRDGFAELVDVVRQKRRPVGTWRCRC